MDVVHEVLQMYKQAIIIEHAGSLQEHERIAEIDISIHKQTHWLIGNSLSHLSLARLRCYVHVRWPVQSDAPAAALLLSDLSSPRYRAGCCSRRHVPAESRTSRCLRRHHRRCPSVQSEAAVGVGVRWHLEWTGAESPLLSATAKDAVPSVNLQTLSQLRFRLRFQNKSCFFFSFFTCVIELIIKKIATVVLVVIFLISFLSSHKRWRTPK